MTRYLTRPPVSENEQLATMALEQGSVFYLNQSGLPDTEVQRAIRGMDIAAAMSSWVGNAHGYAQGQSRDNSLFYRNRYTQSDKFTQQVESCSDAVATDDILMSMADMTVGMAFSDVTVECPDADQEDIWAQIVDDLDLAEFAGEMWREVFSVSQVYISVLWKSKTYTVRTRLTDKPLDDTGPRRRARRKQFSVRVPDKLSVLDPTAVVPVGQLQFSMERFAYLPSDAESERMQKAKDPTVTQLFEGLYQFTEEEQQELRDDGFEIPHDGRAWLFREDACFRHTLTRPAYRRFADVRLGTLLPLLDIKAHLRASDRAILIGATHYILVIRRGTDRWPAKAAEVNQMRGEAKVVARVPILVGDHRLSVDIVTPKTDFTLDDARYRAVDDRILAGALSTIRPTSPTGGGSGVFEGALDLLSKTLTTRRSELTRTLLDELIKPAVSSNPEFTVIPEIIFSPRIIVPKQDSSVINAILKLHDRGDISRETTLRALGFSQDVEYLRRLREVETYDQIFKTSVPFSSPQANPFSGTANPADLQGGGGPPQDQFPSNPSTEGGQ